MDVDPQNDLFPLLGLGKRFLPVEPIHAGRVDD